MGSVTLLAFDPIANGGDHEAVFDVVIDDGGVIRVAHVHILKVGLGDSVAEDRFCAVRFKQFTGCTELDLNLVGVVEAPAHPCCRLRQQARHVHALSCDRLCVDNLAKHLAMSGEGGFKCFDGGFHGVRPKGIDTAPLKGPDVWMWSLTAKLADVKPLSRSRMGKARWL